MEGTSVPLDIQIKPRVFVIGLPKAGKSTLCSRVSEVTGAVHLKMTKVIAYFMS